MGHVQSKRRKEKKRRKITQLSEIMKNMTLTDHENIHKVAGDRIYRDSANLDQLSNSSGYFSSNEPSPHSTGNDVNAWTLENPDDAGECAAESGKYSDLSPWEELCAYKNFPIDDHPALTKLQNEQNTRLEHMELRMSRIRTCAQQAYDRKKFAHLFRAKKEDSRTEQLLQEAREMLQANAERAQSGCDKDNNNTYTGEVIPVQLLEESQESSEKDESSLPLSTFGSLQLSEPIMVLILPFLLPMFIIVAVIRGLFEILGWKQVSFKPKSRRNS